MASRAARAEQGLEDARDLTRTIARELRDARRAAGIAQSTAARAAAMSPSQWGRLERGELARPDVIQVCCAARVLGMRASIRMFPVGQPVRDAPQLALFDRFIACLGAPLRVQREVGLPIEGDLRAWDAMITGAGPAFFADLETHVRDAQALERRLRLKQRDDPRAMTILLVLTRSDHHRRLLAGYREAFRDLLPLDPSPILAALRAGTQPPGSGIVLV
jgi:transcriptional regulator with XRE-family HTH domain